MTDKTSYHNLSFSSTWGSATAGASRFFFMGRRYFCCYNPILSRLGPVGATVAKWLLLHLTGSMAAAEVSSSKG